MTAALPVAAAPAAASLVQLEQEDEFEDFPAHAPRTLSTLNS